MTIEEAVEEVLRGTSEMKCKACKGTGSSFKGGNEVGNAPTSSGLSKMSVGYCTKCDGTTRTITPRHAEARRILGLPPWRPPR